MIIIFLSRVLASLRLVRDALREGAELHRSMTARNPRAIGRE